MTNLHQNEIHYLEESRSERDLGVQITHNLKWDEQVKIASAKANKALGTLTRTFKCWDLRMVKQLFSIYVRPHLEYAASVWNPYNQLHINKIERVQFRATRLVPSLKTLEYDQRLAELGLTTLEDRRTRGDAIQLFKCTKRMNMVEFIHKWHSQNEHIAPAAPAANTRRNHWLLKQKLNLQQRNKFFTNRAVDVWNSLPISTHSSKTVNSFKNSYDRHKSVFKNRANPNATTTRLMLTSIP
jgi:hypothetical protein